jgi:hypothetical protein
MRSRETFGASRVSICTFVLVSKFCTSTARSYALVSAPLLGGCVGNAVVQKYKY